MKTQTWILLAILGFIMSPTAGTIVIGLYIFNYITSLIFGFLHTHQHRGSK